MEMTWENLTKLFDVVGVDVTAPWKGPAAKYGSELKKQFKMELEAIAPQTNPVDSNWQPGNTPSIVFGWAVEALAKAGTLSIVGVYPDAAAQLLRECKMMAQSSWFFIELIIQGVNGVDQHIGAAVLRDSLPDKIPRSPVASPGSPTESLSMAPLASSRPHRRSSVERLSTVNGAVKPPTRVAACTANGYRRE